MKTNWDKAMELKNQLEQRKQNIEINKDDNVFKFTTKDIEELEEQYGEYIKEVVKPTDEAKWAEHSTAIVMGNNIMTQIKIFLLEDRLFAGNKQLAEDVKDIAKAPQILKWMKEVIK